MTSRSGIDRIRLTYPVAGSDSHLCDDSRIIASNVPKMMPPAAASPVRVSVKVIPSLNR